MLRLDRPDAGDGIEPLIGERRCQQGQIGAGHRDGALPEVGIHRRGRIIDEDVEVAEEVADGPIAVARPTLRFVHILVDPHRTTGVALEHLDDPPEPGLG